MRPPPREEGRIIIRVLEYVTTSCRSNIEVQEPSRRRKILQSTSRGYVLNHMVEVESVNSVSREDWTSTTSGAFKALFREPDLCCV